MARFGDRAAWFAFTSNRFDHTSELPPEVNAGNRFYGCDVAEFISDGLTGRGLDAGFLDEDWGWSVQGSRSDGLVLEISIYHNLDATGDDDWVLMVRLLRRERMLGLFPRFRETDVDAETVTLLGDVFGQAGIELRRTPAH